ncbi:hypothetical protein D3C81_2334920 [compost metagenome]
MGDVRQHITHRFLQLGPFHSALVVDIQQPVQIGQQHLQLGIAVEQKQPLM